MKVLNIEKIDNGEEIIDLELTIEERNLIKKEKGWKRLTNKRLSVWFIETLENTIELENMKKE